MKRLNFLTGLVAVALAGASGYLAYQLASERAHARQAEARVAELQSQLNTAERERLAAEEAASAEPPATAAAASPTKPASRKSIPPAANSGPSTGTSQEARDSPQVRMYRTPSSRALLRAERLAQLKVQYPDLARVLGISEPEAQDLLAFLADQDMRRRAGYVKNRQNGDPNFANATQDQQRELIDRIGKDRLQTLETYRKGIPDRAQVRSFRGRLGDSDTLTDAQAESLATALQDERERYAKELTDEVGASATFVFQSVYGRPLMTNNPRTDEDAQERQLMEQMETYTRRAHDRAAGLLTSQQLKAFEEFQAAQLASDRVMVRSMRETDPPK